MTGDDFLRQARDYAESGHASLLNFDPKGPENYNQANLRRAWDHLQTAAENVREAAVAFGLGDPKG